MGPGFGLRSGLALGFAHHSTEAVVTDYHYALVRGSWLGLVLGFRVWIKVRARVMVMVRISVSVRVRVSIRIPPECAVAQD